MLKHDYQIQIASRNYLPQVKKMWADIFGDTDDYIELFFSKVYAPNRALVATVGDTVVSMIFFPGRDMLLQRQHIRVGYVCGAATMPEYRGEGIMTAMIEAAHKYMRLSGDAGAVLIPASDSLYGYYKKRGYHEFFKRDVLTLPAAPPVALTDDIAPLSDLEVLSSLYAGFADGQRNIVLQDAKSYEIVCKEYAEYGRLYQWKEKGFLFCRPEQDRVIVDEFISPEQLSPNEAYALSAVLSEKYPQAREIVIYAPMGTFSGDVKHERNGMLCLFDSPKVPKWIGYMNMMLN